MKRFAFVPLTILSVAIARIALRYFLAPDAAPLSGCAGCRTPSWPSSFFTPDLRATDIAAVKLVRGGFERRRRNLRGAVLEWPISGTNR